MEIQIPAQQGISGLFIPASSASNNHLSVSIAIMGSRLLHRNGPSLHVGLAMVISGVLALQIGCMIEARPPNPSPPPNPPHPTPPHPSPPSPTPTPPSPHSRPPPPPPPSRSPPPPPPSPPPPPPPPPSTQNCTQFGELSEGPYWIDENIEASDVRLNLSYGVPLNVTIKIANATLSELAGTCVPIADARVDLWQCRYDGLYSDEADDGTTGETWLRGYQYTNSTGYTTFYTIYPGWYTSRTVHIHVRVRIYADNGNSTLYDDTSQLFFDDTLSDTIYANVYPYNDRGFAVRDTFNSNDPLFESTNVISLTGSYTDSDGYSSLVELSLPFTTDDGSGQMLRHVDGSGSGFASIL